MSLFDELKRRNVFRVAAAYLALGWIVTQVTSTVAPMLHLPAWIGPVVLWIGVIGFPFVVMFAWIYELTPEGLKRESEVDRGTSITHRTAQRLDVLVIVLLLVAIGLYGWGQFGAGSHARLTVVAEPKATSGSASPAAAPVDRSVAVLPFVDMSAGKNQEYFADGISEEVLNLLAKVPQLRVIARTSSFSFKGKEADIAEIAKKLGVANVLEGSVRTSGDKVRITAQLIRASDSSHLWSETYDRELTDVFAVQDEIAAAVVSQLKVSLLGGAPKARSTDPKAYGHFLRARELYRQYNVDSLKEAESLLGQALAIDPSYAPALVSLAGVYFAQVDVGVRSPESAVAAGKAALARALEADPNSALAYSTLAMYEAMIERNFVSAARNLERAYQIDPANLDAAGQASAIVRRLGRLDLAVELGEYQVSRDPINVDGYDGLGLAYNYLNQLDKSVEAYRTLLDLAPDSVWEHTAFGNILMRKGEYAAALEEYKKEPAEVYRLTGFAVAYRALGRQAESDAALAELASKYGDVKPTGIASVYAERGDAEHAFAMLERAERLKDLDLGAIGMMPAFQPLHGDPRWLPLLRRLGIAPEQLAAIKLDIKVPR